ncbi:MAG TPA: hypothetical protein VJ941_09665, partial [Gracilimonas sp.]|nr:hypothetical protein [Gracilimonas sp.]
MESRKQFIKKLGAGAAAIGAGAFFSPLKARDIKADLKDFSGSPLDIAKNEDYWSRVQQAFTVDRSLINLNNGGVSPSPDFVQAAMKKHLDFSNQAPVYNMWRILEPRREGVRQRLARNFGVD